MGRHLLLASLVASILAACSSGDRNGPNETALDEPFVQQTTRDSYLSGQAFCETYKEITSLELPRYVRVPKDYSDLSKGYIVLYTYTTKSFDPSNPTYIYVDGGPGQNTHGNYDDYFGPEINEIRYDQRGIGCSAFRTYDEYLDSSLLSSRNNVRDLEEIRKAYAIEKWSVYGVSYGTIPATMYGGTYPQSVRSIILEGVIGSPEYIHTKAYKVVKLNLVLSSLNPAERSAFAQLMTEKNASGKRSVASNLFQKELYRYFYKDHGMAALLAKLRTMISPEGIVDRAKIVELSERQKRQSKAYPYAQQPGAVDQRNIEVIYCRDMGGMTEQDYIYFDGQQFAVGTYNVKESEDYCGNFGVSKASVEEFRAANFKTKAPVYYFQGAHDGATTAKGAVENWRSFPRGPSTFLLALRGGHNPGINRMYANDPMLRSAQRSLFKKAVLAEEILDTDVALANFAQPQDEKWLLFHSPFDAPGLERYFEGMRKLPR